MVDISNGGTSVDSGIAINREQLAESKIKFVLA